MKRPVLFITVVLLVYYLICSYIFGTLNWISLEIEVRLISIVFLMIPVSIIFYTIIENKEYFLPTHEEKISNIKRYTGELKEELQLYTEATELEAKAKELRKKHGL